MASRAKQKQASMERILQVASVQLRQEGYEGSSISKIMEEAGLTHGAFYAHFQSKRELAEAAFSHAIDHNHPRWLTHKKESWPRRLKRLASSYLSTEHRSHVSQGCALAALVSEIHRTPEGFSTNFEAKLLQTLNSIAETSHPAEDPQRFNDALMFLVICIGGLNLSRAFSDQDLAERALVLSREAIGKIHQSG